MQLSVIEPQRAELPRSQWIEFFGSSSNSAYICKRFEGGEDGGLAQLARALAWHARGHRFDSDILHPLRADGAPLRCAVFLLIHLARVGPKQPIDEAGSHERIEQKNSTNRAHERGIPGWLGNEERGQEEKGDDQSNDSLGFVLIR